jgi:uncharacterized membrane protein
MIECFVLVSRTLNALGFARGASVEQPVSQRVARFDLIARLQSLRLSFLVALIVCVGTGLRFYHLGDKSLWGDEIWTAQRSVESAWTIVQKYIDLPGPVYYLLAHFSLRIFDHASAEFALRAPSAIASSLTLVAGFFITRRLHGVVPAVILTLLLAVAPYQVWYAQDARFYAVSTLLSLLSWYCSVQIATDKSRFVYWAGFVALTALNFYTQPLPALILLGSQGLCLAIFIMRELSAKLFLAALGAGYVIVLLYRPVLVNIFSGPSGGGNIERYADSSTGQGLFNPGLTDIGPQFVGVVGIMVSAFASQGPVWLCFLALFLIGTGYMARSRKWFDLMWYIAPFFIAVFMFVFLRPANGFNVRYVLFLHPFYLMLVSYGITKFAVLLRELASRRLGALKRDRARLSIIEYGAISLTSLLLVVASLAYTI